jgi:diaminopimelate epimerase
MTYYNADGRTSSMCGNGGRCFAAFARQLDLVGDTLSFIASDGPHEALFTSFQPVTVKLKMQDVKNVEQHIDYLFLNTGSPHYVRFVHDVHKIDVAKEGREVRYSEKFKIEGTNVNFVESKQDELIVRTYERGVEDETYSCGTGVTASVLAAILAGKINNTGKVNVHTLGGELTVHYTKNNSEFLDVWLEGSATFVFDGEVEIVSE